VPEDKSGLFNFHDIEIKVVPSAPVDLATEAKIIDVVKKNLGDEYESRLSYVESIPRYAGGKFEDFMSYVTAG
jgi:phenylacetate-CoA ligase